MKETIKAMFEKNMVYDDITNYGITIIGGEMYLIKDGKRMKLNKMKKIKPIIYNDEVSKCGIMINPKGKMYIIRDGKKMRLNAFIIKEKKKEVN